MRPIPPSLEGRASKSLSKSLGAGLPQSIGIMSSSGCKIMAVGKPHLGAALGSLAFTEAYVRDKVELWSQELLRLSSIAETHPHE